MNKILYFVFLFIYIIFIDYITKMFLYDYKKYIKKDEILNEIKFSWNWQQKYAERKAYFKLLEEFNKKDNNKFNE